MKKIFFYIGVMLLTYTVGISFSLFLNSKSLVDERFAAALTRFYQQNAAKSQRRRQASPQTVQMNIKIASNGVKDSKGIEKSVIESKMAEQIITAPMTQNTEKSPEDIAREIRFTVASDLARTNQNCEEHNYSVFACNRLKENAIKDIEENLLGDLNQ